MPTEFDFELARRQEAAKKERAKLEKRSMLAIRLSPELHGRLIARAHEERISLNSFCIAVLQEAAPVPAPRVVSPS